MAAGRVLPPAARRRTASVGRYCYASHEVLRAWGWTDEQHCAYSAVRGPAGTWRATTAGCPDVRILRNDDRDDDAGWLLCRAGTIHPTADSAN